MKKQGNDPAQASNNPEGLGLFRLTTMVITASICGGIFTLAGDMAANGANTGAVLVGWVICLIGVFALMMCFYGLNQIKPELTGGIYSYASAGFGDYMGFNSAWGYWLSSLLSNVSFATLLFSAIAYFFPIFGEGNNLPSVIGASILLWVFVFFVLKGVKQATGINAVITISKLIPILVFVVAIVLSQKFDWSIFMNNFWGEPGGLSFKDQVMGTVMTTCWVFTGIEGAVVISGRAKKASDVGKATSISFFSVFLLYFFISMLSLGVMPREQMAQLANPSMAGILEHVVGEWGAIIVNLGVVLSLFGAMLGYTIIAAECPYDAATQGVFTKSFAKTNKHGAPITTLIVTNVIIQIFLIILLFNSSTYQVFYTISISMILVPYFFSTAYYWKLAMKKEGFEGRSNAFILRSRILGFIGFLYSLFLIYAGGLVGMMITSILYTPGIFIYIKGKKERGEPYFQSMRDKVVAAAIIIMMVISIVLIATGAIHPF